MNILKYYRIKDWIHYLGYILLGSLVSGNLDPVVFLVGALMLSYAFSFNDYFDKKLKSKFFILPFLISLIFLLFLNELQLIFYFSFILIFTLYSWPITYLEGKPFLSTISNSIGFLLIFFLPFNNVQKILEFLNFSLLLFFLNCAAQIIHEIVDYKNDKKIHKITTVVKFGVFSGILILRVFLLLISLFSILLFPDFKIISFLTIFFSLFFFFLTFKEKVDLNFRRKFKYFGVICGLIWLIDLL